MLVVERQVSHHSHASSEPNAYQPPKPSEESTVEFDVELGDLERTEAYTPAESSHTTPRRITVEVSEPRERAYPLTLGLVVHALADGLALGSASLSDSAAEPTTGGSISGLSLVVFLALVVHKGSLDNVAVLGVVR